MNLIGKFVTNLNTKTRGRPSSPADTRHLIGSWAAMSLLQYFMVERIAVIAWEQWDDKGSVNYDYYRYFVSDLGVHQCITQDAGQAYSRWICSPLFALTDLSLIVLGLGVILTSLLITSTVLRVGGDPEKFITEKEQEAKLDAAETDQAKTKPLRLLFRHFAGEHYGRKVGRLHIVTFFFRLFMFVAGVGLVGLGSNPEDAHPTAHTLTTTVFLFSAVFALVALAIIWWKPRRWSAALIILSAAFAVAGGLVLLATMKFEWTSVPRGTFERFIVYGFIAGVVIMGYTLARSAGVHRRRSEAKREHELRGRQNQLVSDTANAVLADLRNSGNGHRALGSRRFIMIAAHPIASWSRRHVLADRVEHHPNAKL